MCDNEEDATVLLTAGGQESLNDDLQIASNNQQQRLSNNGPAISKPNSNVFLFCSASMAALGGLLFGYDIGIISTALPQIKVEFSLTCFQQEMVVSLMLVGALFASLVGGVCIDKIGSRMAIIVNALVFIAGALLLAFSNSYGWLLVGRFIVGFAVALSAVSECIYISEISTPHNRGMLVSLNEVAITVGFLLAYVVGLIFIDRSEGWRYMFGLSAVPAAGQLLGMFKLPNSPHFLVLKHRDEEAESAVRNLRQLKSTDQVRQELTHIRLSLEAGRSQSCWSLCSSADGLRAAMLIAFGLVMGQQLTGQPNVLNYASTIFEQVGFCGRDPVSATFPTVGLGVVKLAATLVSLLLVDRMGRRKTLLLGALIMAVSLICLGVFALVQQQGSSVIRPTCTDSQPSNHSANATLFVCGSSSSSDVNPGLRYMALAALMAYVAAYSFSFGPVTWLLLSEIFPAAIKGRAMAVSTSVNWATNLVISATFLRTVQLFSLGGVFFGYAILTFLSIIFIFLVVPETRNKTLHRITKELETTTFAGRMAQHARQFPCFTDSSWLLKLGGNYSQLANNSRDVVMEMAVS